MNKEKMKTIGIVVAMDRELSLFTETYNMTKEEKPGGLEFYIGSMDEERLLIISKSGIGKVNSAMCAQTMINNYHPDYIISSGVCGSLARSGVRQGDIVIATEVRYHDVWCGNPNEHGQVQDMPASFKCFPVDTDGIKYMCHKGLIVSGDWFVETKEIAEKIDGLVPGSVGLDMESGSIAQACYRHGVPFVSIRIVSDTPLTEVPAKYEDFWANAPTMLNTVVKTIITNSL